MFRGPGLLCWTTDGKHGEVTLKLLSGKDLLPGHRSVVEWFPAVISPGMALQTAVLLEVTSVLGGTYPLTKRGSGT